MRIFADLLPGTDESRITAAGAEVLRRASDGIFTSGPDRWVPISAPDDIATAPEGAGLWLRGYESAGPVSAHTALILIRAASASGRKWIASGLGPRAMAASLTVGAAGIVVDVPLWAVASSPLASQHREALTASTSGRDTRVVDGVRILSRTAQGASGSGLHAPQSVGTLPLGETVEEALQAVKRAVQAHLEAIQSHRPLSRDPLGTGAPIVQGPMANISEGTGLARAVADAGALPFAALGALRPDDARDVLAAHAELDRPWGAGVIGFDVMPHRDAHLDAIRALGDRGPQAIILAGASPQLARALSDEGLPIWLHTPSGRLARSALSAGIPAVVLEGHEAGGHVGQLTSVGLWEEGLAAAERCGRGLVVLAGGIGDRVSAAFAAAMGARAVGAGAEVVLQAGTAFLFTHEILESGQITTAYQQSALGCEDTVLVGATVNLPLRCAPNRFAREARAMEHAWAAEGLPRLERRQRLEHHNLGRTRIAAKAVKRNSGFSDGGPRYIPVPRREQIAEGAFSLGQGATLAREIQTVAQLVQSLCRGPERDRKHTPPRWGDVSAVPGRPGHERPTPRFQPPSGPAPLLAAQEPIAVVGLGCVVPGAFDISRFWTHLVEGVDAVAPVPTERWSPERYFDPNAGTQGPVKSYARLAGAIQGFHFDPLDFRIPPRVLRTLDPSQQLALAASRQAVEGAGWSSGIDRRRAAVVLGNSMGGEYAKSLALRVRFREVLAALDEDASLEHLDDAARAALHDRVEARLAAGLPPVDVDSMPGLLSNVVAGRVASWLDWMGGNMTVDAACAASLAAVTVAVDWLRSGRCDAVLTGGVDTDLAPETYVGFCRTGALSRTGSSPFSRDADGFVMGEGCAVLALKRLSDALRDGDPVWGVIRGVGQSSDGRGRSITAPRAEGQRLAIERAYAQVDFGPEDVGMIEAHGTGTALGDATEVGVLSEHFRHRSRPTWLGSVKSMLGHLKGGAGAAGLTKAVLSVATGVIPPTLHAGPLNPALDLDRGPFRLPRQPVAFPDDCPRAGVSAFGFGGTNYHILVEAPPPEARVPAALDALRRFARPRVRPAAVAAWGHQDRTPLMLAYGAEEASGLIDAVAADQPTSPREVARSPHRLVLLTTPTDRRRDLARAVAWLRTQPRELALAGNTFRGIGPATPAVVVVPGQGTQRTGAWDSVATVPAGAEALHALALPTSHVAQGRAPSDAPLALHRSLYGVAVAWGAVLKRAELPIAATLGHSLGELGALVIADRLDPKTGLELAEARGQALQACPEGAMVAVQGDAEAIAHAHGLVVAAQNTPQWHVLSGPTEAVQGVEGQRLRVSRAFHSPAVHEAEVTLRRVLGDVRFTEGAPCYSVCTAAPFQDPAEELAQAITSPVRFAETVSALREHTLFVEVGPGRFLSRCIEATLPEARAIPLDPRPGDPSSIPSAAAALLAAGHAGLVEDLPGTLVQLGLSRARTTQTAPTTPRSAPAPELEGSPSKVRDAVMAAICEVSGYPPDFLDTSADLEGDLGIDSIRKMEILALLEERLGFTTRESDYAALSEARIETLVAHVEARLDAPEQAAESAPASAFFTTELELPIAPPERTGAGANRYESGPSSGDIVTGVHAQVRDWMRRAPSVSGPMVVVCGVGPVGAASAGFARSLARERGTSVRIITVHPGVSPEVVDAEADARDRPAHVILRPDGAFERVSTPTLPVEGPPPEAPVILATGGASGIVLACLRELAPLSPRILLLGRRPADISELGAEAVYRQCDLTDREAVGAAVDHLYDRWGRLDIVLHGAGTLRDGPVESLDEDDCDAVLGPKIDGTAHLFSATRDRPPALWIALSSIVATVGNAGQTLYGAANAALEAWPHPTATRSLSIPFTAWSELGMASQPALQALLRSRGIRSLPVAAGTRALRTLIRATNLPPIVQVTAQHLPTSRALPWPLGSLRSRGPDHLSVHIPLDPADPALDHHRVGGRPLVPAALWVCALQQAAALIDGHRGARLLEALAVHAPTFVERTRADVYTLLRRTDNTWHGQIVAGDTVVAEAHLGQGSLDTLGAPPAPLKEPTSAADLYTPEQLFHGPHWRVLARIEPSDNGRSRADVIPPDGLQGTAAAVDAAHQLLSMWSGRETGWLGLPVGARRWIVSDHIAGPLRLTSWARTSEGGVVADIRATDASGRVVIQGEGVQLKPAARWPGAHRG